MTKFNYKKWLTENRDGHANINYINEQEGVLTYYGCSICASGSIWDINPEGWQYGDDVSGQPICDPIVSYDIPESDIQTDNQYLQWGTLYIAPGESYNAYLGSDETILSYSNLKVSSSYLQCSSRGVGGGTEEEPAGFTGCDNLIDFISQQFDADENTDNDWIVNNFCNFCLNQGGPYDAFIQNVEGASEACGCCEDEADSEEETTQTYGNTGSTLDGDTCPENAMSIILSNPGGSFNLNMYCVTVDGQTPQVGDIVISTNGNQGEILQTAEVGSGEITGTGGNAIFNLQLVSSGTPEPEDEPVDNTEVDGCAQFNGTGPTAQSIVCDTACPAFEQGMSGFDYVDNYGTYFVQFQFAGEESWENTCQCC